MRQLYSGTAVNAGSLVSRLKFWLYHVNPEVGNFLPNFLIVHDSTKIRRERTFLTCSEFDLDHLSRMTAIGCTLNERSAARVPEIKTAKGGQKQGE